MLFKKEWNEEDQECFARLSGDFNPIHVEFVAARRSIFGKAVVHGVHILFWTINEYARVRQDRGALKKLKVNFRKPLVIGEQAELSFDDSNNVLIARVSSRGELCCKITAEFDRNSGIFGKYKFQRSFISQKSKERSAEEMIGLQGSVQIGGDMEALRLKYPDLCKALPEDQLAFLLTTTRLIGMECPGLFSIYSDMEIDFTKENVPLCDDLKFEVLEFNPVFNLTRIQVRSTFATGELQAFVRPVLQRRDLTGELRLVVKQGEFTGQRALIIGGSRGLGEVAAKALALGGADVVITYINGKKDAEAVGEALSNWAELFKIIPLDVRWPDQDILKTIPHGWHPTHMYYFATPFIFDGIKKRFNEKLFNGFSEIYVHGFWRVFEAVYSLGSLKYALYPSSSALEELQANMFEYTVAKAAGEKMCDYIRKFFPEIDLACPRLGRLATDQTVSLLPVDNQDPIPVILSILRRSIGQNDIMN